MWGREGGMQLLDLLKLVKNTPGWEKQVCSTTRSFEASRLNLTFLFKLSIPPLLISSFIWGTHLSSGKAGQSVCSSILNYYFLQGLWFFFFSSFFFFTPPPSKRGPSSSGQLVLAFSQFSQHCNFAGFPLFSLLKEWLSLYSSCGFPLICPSLCKFALLFWLSIYTNSSSLYWSTLFPFLPLWLLTESFSEFLLWLGIRILRYVWVITIPCFRLFHWIALHVYFKKFNLAPHKLCRDSASPPCCWQVWLCFALLSSVTYYLWTQRSLFVPQTNTYAPTCCTFCPLRVSV